jgi:flagellar hook-basal body complex protein FliE
MKIGSLPILNPRDLHGLQDPTRTAQGGGLGKADAGASMGATSGKSFNNLLEKAVSEVDGKMQSAEAEKAKLLTGESTNLHQAVIAMQEASVAFGLMVEVRNKLVESYQEMMRMQV